MLTMTSLSCGTDDIGYWKFVHDNCALHITPVMVLLDTGHPGTSREIFSEDVHDVHDVHDGTRTSNPRLQIECSSH